MTRIITKSTAGRRFFIFPLRWWLVFGLLWLAAGCAGSRIRSESPAALYQQAETAFQKEKYSKATELFQAVQNEFPDSDYARLALLRCADIFYSRKELEEAARAYNDFINFNGDHPKAPYAKYQVGMSYSPPPRRKRSSRYRVVVSPRWLARMKR